MEYIINAQMDAFFVIMYYIALNVKNITNLMRKKQIALKKFQIVMNMKVILFIKSLEKVLDFFMMTLYYIICYPYDTKIKSEMKVK